MIGCQGAPDTEPTAFQFSTIENAELSAELTSPDITLSNINTPILVSTSEGKIVSGDNQGAQLTLTAGATFRVIVTSPSLPRQNRAIRIRAGSYETNWLISTRAGSTPTARIKAPSQMVLTSDQESAEIHMSAIESFDPDDDITHYRWQDHTGEIKSTRFEYAPELKAGVHRFTLTIEDSEGHQSTDEKTIVLLPSAAPWLTKGDQTQALTQQTDTSWTLAPRSANSIISVNDAITFQTLEGLGFALTQGSAAAIQQLPAIERNALLQELFSKETGLGISMLRITVGASDLSTSLYSYDDVAGDTELQHFSLDGPDSTTTFPVLKEILAINPNIKLLASPWSAPPWMKTNNSWVGGKLKPEHQLTYARYLIRYLDEMKALGFRIWGLTPQNEPLHDGNEPSMAMSADEQLYFIENYLGKLLTVSQHFPKILAYDHNCDHPEYPIKVATSQYVAGSAFHLYGGDISALSEVKAATQKDVYFTEQWTSSSGNFDGDFGWHMENIVIGATRNWARTVLEWNLASTPPSLARGCLDCQGAISIDENSHTVTRHVSYYIIGQLSRFLKGESARIQSSENSDGLFNVAFVDFEDKRTLLIYNATNEAKEVAVLDAAVPDAHLPVSIPARSAITLSWPKFTLNPISAPL